MANAWDMLGAADVLARIVVPSPVRDLLKALDEVRVGDPSQPVAAAYEIPVPGFLGATLPKGALFSCTLAAEGPEGQRTGFVLDLTPVAPIDLRLAQPGVAAAVPAPGGQAGRMVLQAVSGPARLTLGIGLRIAGTAGGSATLTAAGPVGVQPAYLLLPGDVGLSIPQGIAVEATGPTSLTIRNAALILPASVPLLGGVPVPISIGFLRNGGLDAQVEIDVPAADGVPAVRGRLEWHDAQASGFDALVPTSGELVVGVAVAGQAPPPLNGSRLDGPPHVDVRARFARPPGAPDGLEVTVAVESPDPGGLVRLQGTDSPALVAASAVVLAAAVVAGGAPAGVDGAGVVALPALLAAAAAVGEALASYGDVVLHGVAVEAGTARALTISADVSASIAAKTMDLGPVKVSMDQKQPLRVRWRGVRVVLAVDGEVAVSFAAAQLDVEDPGGWHVSSPMTMLEVIGSRSGRGSIWLEVDLRFALDLGPVTITGATIRATFDGGALSLSLRGLGVRAAVPGLLEGTGQATLAPDGLDLVLGATLVPLQTGMLAVFRTHEVGGVRSIELAFGIDLPGPVPLGPTGLGLFGVLGAVGINARMPSLDGPDPGAALLAWKPWEAMETAAGHLTLGAGLVIGTAADLGFTFSSLAVLGVTVPDLALRAGLDGRILSGRHLLAEVKDIPPSQDGLRLRGGLSVDGAALVLALRGDFVIPGLLEVEVPVALRYPYGPDWWFHAGTDGSPSRPPGPATARVLPGLLDLGGWAFLMAHGNGIDHLKPLDKDLHGFAVAAGVGFRIAWGVVPIAWFEVDGSVVAAVASDPFVVMASGRIVGSMNLGPFSVGVDSRVNLQVGPGPYRMVKAHVCGEVDLWLTTLRGCVTIEILSGDPEIPDPAIGEWPFPDVTLADGLGSTIVHPDEVHPDGVPPLRAGATDDGAAFDWQAAPVVWPDTIPLLTFPVAPVAGPGVPAPTPPVHDGKTGSEQLTYTWTLQQVSLHRIGADGKPVEPVPLDKAAWQVPVGVPSAAAGIATHRQLALLTTHRLLWARNRADGGNGLPLGQDPVTPTGLCSWEPRLVAGWSLGLDAVAAPQPAATWRVPPESRAFGVPRARIAQSGVALLVTTRYQGTVWDAARARMLDIPGAISAGGPVRYLDALDTPARAFGGALRLPSTELDVDDAVDDEQHRRARVEDDIVFSEPVEGDQGDGGIWFLVPDAGSGLITARSRHAGGSEDWEVVERESPSPGAHLVLVRPGAAAKRPSLALTLVRPPWLAIDLLGAELLAISDTQEAATARDTARRAAEQDARDAAKPPGANRQLLRPRSHYRVEVTLGGTRTSVDPGLPPRDLGTHARYYLFSTSGDDEAAVPPPGPPSPGRMNWADQGEARPQSRALLRRDHFDPTYLERYLAGYTPGDRTMHWFCEDPVQAHFTAGHVVELAAAYGRDLVVRVQRTDGPPGPGEASTWEPQGALGPLVSASRFPIDSRIEAAAVASGCAVPREGGTATVAAKMAPSASYELAVAFPVAGRPPGGARGAPGLPGVVFTTSAFANPGLMLDALRFGVPGQPGRAHGDLRAIVPPPFDEGDVTADGGLEAALSALGLAGLPPARAARTSVIWVPDGPSWGAAGVLLEAPEPIHRADRLRLDSITLAGTPLPIIRRDRVGARLLWLASAPVPLGRPGPIFLQGGEPAGAWQRELTVDPLPVAAGAPL